MLFYVSNNKIKGSLQGLNAILRSAALFVKDN